MAWQADLDVEERLRPYVEYILHALLLPGELRHWGFVWREEEGTRQLAAEVFAAGDGYYGYLFLEGGALEPEDALDTFTDGFEDFISESRFAWGQQRLLVDRPWNKVQPG